MQNAECRLLGFIRYGGIVWNMYLELGPELTPAEAERWQCEADLRQVQGFLPTYYPQLDQDKLHWNM